MSKSNLNNLFFLQKKDIRADETIAYGLIPGFCSKSLKFRPWRLIKFDQIKCTITYKENSQKHLIIHGYKTTK